MEENTNKIVKFKIGSNGTVVSINNYAERIDAIEADFNTQFAELNETIASLRAEVQRLQEIIDNYDKENPGEETGSSN